MAVIESISDKSEDKADIGIGIGIDIHIWYRYRQKEKFLCKVNSQIDN